MTGTTAPFRFSVTATASFATTHSRRRTTATPESSSMSRRTTTSSGSRFSIFETRNPWRSLETMPRTTASRFRRICAPLRPYHRLEEGEVRAADGGDPARAMRAEGEAILKLIDPADHVWLLERTGETLSSEELSQRIERLPHDGIARVTFVVAGTFGASEALLARADVRWSLSPL